MEVGNSLQWDFGAEPNPQGMFDPWRTEQVTYIEGPGTRVRAYRPIMRARWAQTETQRRRRHCQAAKFEEETERFFFPVIHVHSEWVRTQTADSKCVCAWISTERCESREAATACTHTRTRISDVPGSFLPLNRNVSLKCLCKWKNSPAPRLSL